MKIPLDVRKHSEGYKPFLTLYVKVPSQKLPGGATVKGIVYSFVDTGSPYTIICENDARRLGIKVHGKPRMILLGGSQLHSYYMKGVVLKAVCEDKKTVCDLSIPEVGVIQPIPNVPKSIEVSKSIPSIIGVDLLEYHKLALYFDVYNKVAYLEKV